MSRVCCVNPLKTRIYTWKSSLNGRQTVFLRGCSLFTEFRLPPRVGEALHRRKIIKITSNDYVSRCLRKTDLLSRNGTDAADIDNSNKYSVGKDGQVTEYATSISQLLALSFPAANAFSETSHHLKIFSGIDLDGLQIRLHDPQQIVSFMQAFIGCCKSIQSHKELRWIRRMQLSSPTFLHNASAQIVNLLCAALHCFRLLDSNSVTDLWHVLSQNGASSRCPATSTSLSYFSVFWDEKPPYWSSWPVKALINPIIILYALKAIVRLQTLASQSTGTSGTSRNSALLDDLFVLISLHMQAFSPYCLARLALWLQLTLSSNNLKRVDHISVTPTPALRDTQIKSNVLLAVAKQLYEKRFSLSKTFLTMTAVAYSCTGSPPAFLQDGFSEVLKARQGKIAHQLMPSQLDNMIFFFTRNHYEDSELYLLLAEVISVKCDGFDPSVSVNILYGYTRVNLGHVVLPYLYEVLKRYDVNRLVSACSSRHLRICLRAFLSAHRTWIIKNSLKSSFYPPNENDASSEAENTDTLSLTPTAKCFTKCTTDRLLYIKLLRAMAKQIPELTNAETRYKNKPAGVSEWRYVTKCFFKMGLISKRSLPKLKLSISQLGFNEDGVKQSEENPVSGASFPKVPSFGRISVDTFCEVARVPVANGLALCEDDLAESLYKELVRCWKLSAEYEIVVNRYKFSGNGQTLSTCVSD